MLPHDEKEFSSSSRNLCAAPVISHLGARTASQHWSCWLTQDWHYQVCSSHPDALLYVGINWATKILVASKKQKKSISIYGTYSRKTDAGALCSLNWENLWWAAPNVRLPLHVSTCSIHTFSAPRARAAALSAKRCLCHTNKYSGFSPGSPHGRGHNGGCKTSAPVWIPGASRAELELLHSQGRCKPFVSALQNCDLGCNCSGFSLCSYSGQNVIPPSWLWSPAPTKRRL